MPRSPTPPCLDVACAVLLRADGRVLAARRRDDQSQPGKWEFPGGKLEPGEDSWTALVRELHEELHAAIEPIRPLPATTHAYPNSVVRLHPWVCHLSGPEPQPLEHAELRWLPPTELRQLDWAAADLPVLDTLGW